MEKEHNSKLVVNTSSSKPSKSNKEQIKNSTPNINDTNNELLEGLLSNLSKKYGPSVVRILNTDPTSWNIDTISSGSLLLDEVTGIGGYPKGRIIEIYGPESSGKTTLGLHAIAECQKQKKDNIAVFMDIEHALDPCYAKNIGIDIDNLIVAQPDSGEEALNILETLVSSNLINLIVLDSVAALVPQLEMEQSAHDQTIGLQARLMSKMLRKIKGIVYKNNITLIFINQIRSNIGVFFGNKEVTPGGRALKFYSSLRLEIRRIETLKKNGTALANRVRVKITKNKLAAPFQIAVLEIHYGKGLNKHREILELALKYGLLIRKGTWYSYEDNKIGQGQDAVFQYWTKHPKNYQTIYKSVLNFLTKGGTINK